MQVLVTGGAGRIGRVIVDTLLEAGWAVRVIDVVDHLDIPGAEYSVCDLLDFDKVKQQVEGCDAVVHMAALPSATRDYGQTVFQINVAGTFNVFEAAAQAGVRRVVQASSINAIGCAWNLHDFAPPYLPLDEAMPRVTDDPYSFSKQLVEDIGDYYWRRDGIVSVAMRYPAVLSPDYLNSDDYLKMKRNKVALLDELRTLDEEIRAHKLADARERVLAHRLTRPLEYNPARGPVSWGTTDDLLFHMYMMDRFNLWAFIDVRDAALAVKQALVADIEGSHALFINADRNALGYDSALLAEWFFPDVVLNKPLVDAEALVSIARARELIDFKLEFS